MQFDSANSYGKIRRKSLEKGIYFEEQRLLRENETPILENQSLLDRIKTLETIVDELHKVLERIKTLETIVDELHKVLERQQCEIVNLKIFIGFKC